MKISLAEFDAFQKQVPDDWYFEGDEAFVDEEFWKGNFDPSKTIDVRADDITMCYQGCDDSVRPEDRFKDFILEFRGWKRGSKFEIITLEIPKGMKGEIEKLVAGFIEDKKKKGGA